MVHPYRGEGDIEYQYVQRLIYCQSIISKNNMPTLCVQRQPAGFRNPISLFDIERGNSYMPFRPHASSESDSCAGIGHRMEAAFPYRDVLQELQLPPLSARVSCGLFCVSFDMALTRMRHILRPCPRRGDAPEKR